MKSNFLFGKTIDCIYRTRKGTLYHLTDHNQKSLAIHNVQINLAEFMGKEHIFDLISQDKISFKKYLNFEKYVTYVTIFDPLAQKKILGSSKEDSVRVFINGYKDISIAEFLKYAKLTKPDVLVSFSEVPEITDSGAKRNKRAAAKNSYFLQETLKAFKDTNTMVLAPINASKFEDILETTIEGLKAHDPQGYVIQGLYLGESAEERAKILEAIQKTLGENIVKEKNIVLSSDGNPVQVLDSLKYGINLFEVEYPFALAEKGFAIAFNPTDFYEYKADGENRVTERAGHEYKAKTINLFDNQYKEVLEPLDSKCSCYSCKNHTKAYIHHLLECDEMTANVLLTIHNVHMYSKFFEVLEKEEKNLPAFTEWFLATQCQQVEKKDA